MTSIMIFICGWISSVSHAIGRTRPISTQLESNEALMAFNAMQPRVFRLLCGKCTREQGQTRDGHF